MIRLLEFLGIGIALILFIVAVLVAIVISGFFLWIALKIVGEDRGIIEAGIANLVAGFASLITLSILSLIPPLILLSPVIAFVVYVYVLDLILHIGFVKAIAVSVIANLVFLVVSGIIAMVLGVASFYPVVHSMHYVRRPF